MGSQDPHAASQDSPDSPAASSGASFPDRLMEGVRPLWDRMLSHPFLLRTRDGTLPDATFRQWLRQDYLFVEAAIPFIAALIPKAPVAHQGVLSDVLPALRKELELFEERAGKLGVDLREVPPSFTCHAYVQFLLSTGYRGTYGEGLTVLYGAEKAYHESWKVVAEGLDPDSPWQPFVENWAGEDFAGWVAWLEEELDGVARRTSPDERAGMAELFRLTTLYEIAFWEMAFTEESWPGLEGLDPFSGVPGAAGTTWTRDPTGEPEPAWSEVVRDVASGDDGGSAETEPDETTGWEA